MKKIIIISIIALSLVLSSAAVFAATDCSTGTSPCPSAFKASTNVTISCSSAAQTYAAASGHLNGNKQYGVTSASTSTYVSNKTAGSTISAVGGNDSTAFSGWSSM